MIVVVNPPLYLIQGATLQFYGDHGFPAPVTIVKRALHSPEGIELLLRFLRCSSHEMRLLGQPGLNYTLYYFSYRPLCLQIHVQKKYPQHPVCDHFRSGFTSAKNLILCEPSRMKKTPSGNSEE